MNEIKNGKTQLDTFVDDILSGTFSKILKVNVSTGKFEVYKDDGLLDADGLNEVTDIYAYMQKLITDEIIYPEYATTCRRFTNPEYVRKSVFSGERRLVQSYRRRTANGDKWITFAIVAGSDCGPENPMVLYTWREADSDAITLLDTLPSISSLYDKLIRLNLSNNTYEPVIVDADEQEQLVGGVINMVDWWDEYSKEGNIAPEDMGVFSTLTKAGSLQKLFSEDPTPINFRYRRKVGDDFRWVQLQIAPSVEYSEENQIMLLSLKDIHEEYTAEMRSRQELIDSLNRDALTNLLNRLKFNEDIAQLSKGSDPFFTCLYVDVNGLHELNNLLGHQRGDEMLCCVADTLRKYFPDEKIYRIGGDEFVVTSTKLWKRTVEVTVQKVRRDLLKYEYEISVGVDTGAGGKNIEKVVEAAELKMRNDKATFYMRNGDRRRNRSMNEELEQMLTEKHDSERFLNIISDQFSGVLFVDLLRDTLRHIYIPDLFTALLEEANDRFTAAMRLYVKKHVKREYHDCFNEILSHDRLHEKFREADSLQFSYQKTDGVRMNLRIAKGDSPETIWIFTEDAC